MQKAGAMGVVRAAALLALLLGASPAGASQAGATLTINPIRRVVVMLQMMQKKVEAEGKKEKELFDKFMCWCEGGGSALEASIKAAEEKIPQLESQIKELGEKVEQLVADLKKHKADRAEAQEAVANGKALRKKEHEAFLKESEDDKANLAALEKAIAAIEKGSAGAFLQTSAASALRRLTVTLDISNSDRDALSAFLSQGQGEDVGYAPQSGEIVGILKQMKDTMAKSTDSKTNIDALATAIAALEKGMSGAFLQTSAAKVLRQLVITLDLSAVDRDSLSAFLTQGGEAGSGYAPQSGEIVGILKQMKDTMEA